MVWLHYDPAPMYNVMEKKYIPSVIIIVLINKQEPILNSSLLAAAVEVQIEIETIEDKQKKRKENIHKENKFRAHSISVLL